MFPKEESQKNDSWEQDAVLELLYRAPELATEDDLQGISLRNLAKNVNDELTSPMVMKIYIRWLEAHRKSSWQSFNAWPNTIKQWVESLKHRGLDKEEVILGVLNWKKANGPFNRYSKEWIEEKNVEEKHLPSVDEVKRAFDEKHTTKKERSLGRVNSKKGGFQTDRPSGKLGSGGGPSDHVPMSYVCNRCGKNGHSVKNCPTNMDPTFDKNPPETYKCCICNKFGKHWFGLCPNNTDKDSITQRRLAAGIETPNQYRRLNGRDAYKPKLDDKWMLNDKKYKGRERDSKHSGREKWETFGTSDSVKQEHTKTFKYDDSEEPELPDRTGKLELLADIEERMHPVSAATARDTGMSIESVTDMTGMTVPNMAVTITAASRKRARSMYLDDVSYREYQRPVRKKLEHDDTEEIMDDVGDTRSMHLDNQRRNADVGGILKETDPYTDEFGLHQNLKFTTVANPAEYSVQLGHSDLVMRPRKMSPTDTSSEQDIQTPVDDMEEGFDSPRVRSETPEKIYSDFVKSLIRNRTEGQVVNQGRRRPTALEKWDDDDRRRMGRLSISKSTPQNSPTLSSNSFLTLDFTDDVNKVDPPINHSIHRAVSEIPHFSFEHNTPVSPTSDIAMPEGSADFDDGNASEYVDEECSY